jgi:renalase
MKPWDVIVVGAGVAGMTIARLLTDQGQQVLVLDKSHRPGGRLATKNVGGMALDSGAISMVSADPAVQTLLTGWLGAKWFHAPHGSGSAEWEFSHSARDIAEAWAYGLKVQRTHVTHLITDRPGVVGVVRHGFGDVIWGQSVVLTAPIPQSQAIIAYSDLVLDYALDSVSYRKRQVLLASLEGEGLDPDSHWSTDIIESVRFRPHPDGLLGIEANARQSWSEATWDDDATISQGRLLVELGLLVGHARVVDTQVMRWRYAMTDEPHPAPYWRHPDTPAIWMAGDGFGDPIGPAQGIERAVHSAQAVVAALSR